MLLTASPPIVFVETCGSKLACELLHPHLRELLHFLGRHSKSRRSEVVAHPLLFAIRRDVDDALVKTSP